MVKFSVIIPVYNTKKNLLERCLQSIKNQTCLDYELIIVDDGSREDNAKIIDAFSGWFPLCKVIHTFNQGASKARNTGIKNAAGEYVVFVDSDDIIAPYMLEEMEMCIEQFARPDIVYGLIKRERSFSGFQKSHLINLSNARMIDRREIHIELFPHMVALTQKKFFDKDNAYLSRGPIARAVKRSIAVKNLFPSNIVLGEDGIWNIMLLNKIERAVFLKSTWYYYIINEESSLYKYNDKIADDNCEYLTCLHDLSRNIKGVEAAVLANTLERMVGLLRSKYAHNLYPGNLKQANEDYRRVINDKVYTEWCKWEYIKKLSFKEMIIFLLVKINRYPVITYKAIRYVRDRYM